MDPHELENLNAQLEQDAEIREKIKGQVNESDKRTRNMISILNKIHSIPPGSITELVDQVRPIVADMQGIMSSLADVIPPNQFWRWRDMWCNSLRSAVFAAAMVEYLSSGTLISLARTSELLGIKQEWKDRVTLSVEDYLHGLISLVNELSRLAVNSVTMGNFNEPIKISLFVKDVFAGFSVLNLKNDILRKRFDGLKYDLKKIEEVVYDVALRNLAKPQTAAEERPGMF